ncbi:MAG: M48 family metallopeptidase [Caldisericaceae bacterium]|uniref:M48 family metallopeptidase n=1 Tax=Caldisericum sp. TaxID=2499687 RepID=UPI003D0DB0C3
MNEIEIEQIIHSKRKTIAIEVTDRATLIVKAPYFVSKVAVNKVIEKHKSWINKRIAIAKTIEKPSSKGFVSGESFLYLGRTYRLFIVYAQEEPFKFDNAFYLREDMQPFAKDIFINWYRNEARKFISERVNYYSNLAGIKYNKVKITSAMKRWGSCSRERNLSFTYRLVMAPIFVIDYVIVHELCHIIEHNHSKTFWEHVKVILPGYKNARAWLNEKGQMLVI